MVLYTVFIATALPAPAMELMELCFESRLIDLCVNLCFALEAVSALKAGGRSVSHCRWQSPCGKTSRNKRIAGMISVKVGTSR